MPRPPLTRSAAAARAIASVGGPGCRAQRAGARHAAAPTFVALCVLALCGVTLSGAAASTAAALQAGGVPLSLAITSVSPDFASPGKPVTVTGTVTNTSDSRLGGLSVQLRSSSLPFYSREALQEYADGTTKNDQGLGVSTDLTKPLAPRATVTWKVTLPGSQLPMSGFGVYPLAAEVDSAFLGQQLAVSRTFLPFWAGTKSLGDPQPQDVAWIWPLIDQPRQGRCLGLLNNGLAASFGGGRLAGLLQAGRPYTQSAQLTWAIDPALLANAVTMSKAYAVGGVAGCHGSSRPSGPDSLRPERASQPARAWLAGLQSATAGQQVFVTPYDDADIAALTRYNLGHDLDRAFTEGRLLAGHVLSRDFTSTAGGTAADAYGIAWPADGSANRADLAHLAASDKISTVVLDSTTMPPSPQQTFTPSAQTTAPDGTPPGMGVLVSDDTISQLIGSASATSGAATRFSVEQRFLAETAMIAAERPGVARSIVVAPPRQWDPPAGLASDLLYETVHAPWLRPASLAQLAAVKHPAGQVTRQAPPMTVSGAHLGQSLATQVRQLDQQSQVLASIQAVPSPSPVPGPDRGVFAIESSAWRGLRAGQQALADQISALLTSEERKLKIVVTQREQLTGKTGTVPVSVANRLPYDVRVRLEVDPGGGVTVKKQPRLMLVPAGEQVIVRLQVTASGVGSTNLTLSLLTLSGAPIPGARASMTIQATHYGTLALVIIAAVLGVFVISSGIKTFRRRGRRGRDGASSSDPPGPSPGPGEAAPDAGPVARDAAASWPERRDLPEGADTVVSDRIKTRRSGPRHVSTGHDLAEGGETDDYAWTPGWTDRR
jgi:Family of unknown function (DUF6049)